jgi:rhodanese-related sulfurtransferase
MNLHGDVSKAKDRVGWPRGCRVAAIVLAAWVPAVVAFRLNPHRPEWDLVGEATWEVVRAWPEVLWIDARSADAFDRGHVPGAFNLSPDSWEARIGAVLAAWTPERPVVVYCDGGGCRLSHEVARRLRDELGFTHLHVLAGGWDARKGGLR